MRKRYLIANWKMNMLRDESTDFVFNVSTKVPPIDQLITVICPHYLILRTLIKRQGDVLRMGAQNMHYEISGPYTGEVSPIMIANMGAEYVIIGHSERRTQFNETDETINKKVLAAFANKLTPILCIGENSIERDDELTLNVIERQLFIALRNVPALLVPQIVIAYEPLWAIGTGNTATPDLIEAVAKKTRDFITERFSKEVADQTSILYGGSVSINNIEALNSLEDVDGFLVGKAALDPKTFLDMANLMISRK